METDQPKVKVVTSDKVSTSGEVICFVGQANFSFLLFFLDRHNYASLLSSYLSNMQLLAGVHESSTHVTHVFTLLLTCTRHMFVRCLACVLHMFTMLLASI
jgi:hypothetical protein